MNAAKVMAMTPPARAVGAEIAAINRGALHQGPNDPQVFLSAVAFVHQNNFVIQSLKADNKNFCHPDAVEGPVMKL